MSQFFEHKFSCLCVTHELQFSLVMEATFFEALYRIAVFCFIRRNNFFGKTKTEHQNTYVYILSYIYIVR